MQRRRFLTAAAGAGLGAGALASPAIAQTQPEVKWRLASSFPKNLDTLFGSGDLIARRVAEATDGRFQIRTFAAGEIVPGLQVLDAVQAGTVECGHTVSYYYVGKDPTLGFESTMPFGTNARQQNAWLFQGGGLALMREVFRAYNVINFPAGNTGTQMGGWFRKEIKTVDDLKGLKFRIAGYAGRVLTKLGVVPQQLSGGDVYPSLEKGTIDAAEWVGPYDDEKLGLFKVAPYYYYPGWWEGGPTVTALVNLDAWEKLPKSYRAAFELACAEANQHMQTLYDVQNPAALKRLVAQGAKLRPFSKEILQACYKAAQDTFAEDAAANPTFRKVFEHWSAFLDDQRAWFRVAEFGFDNFVLNGLPKK